MIIAYFQNLQICERKFNNQFCLPTDNYNIHINVVSASRDNDETVS